MSAVVARRFTNNALYVCLAAMDGLWLYLVVWLAATFVWSRIEASAVPTPWMLALVELASVWVALRLLKNEQLPDWLVQTLSGALGLGLALAVSLLVNPPGAKGPAAWIGSSFLGILACLVAWFLGGMRASSRPGFNQAFNMFRFGLGIIGISAVMTALIGQGNANEAWAGLSGVSLWFFAWSLAALALGNREVVREEAGDASTGSWSMMLIGAIVVIMLVGSTVGVFGTGNVLGLLQNIVAGVLLAVGTVIYLLFWLIFQITGVFNPQVKENHKGPKEVEDAYRIVGRFGSNPKDMEASFNGLGVPPEVYNALIWGTVILVAVVVIWLVSRSMRRANRGFAGDATEERERIGSWEMLVSQLRMWANMLLARFRPAHAPAGETIQDDLAALKGKPEWSGTLSVRQIYARLQKLAAGTGYARNPQQTPVEYLRVLQAAMPDLRQEFAAITSAYIEARYGPTPASGPAVHAAQEAWKRTEPRLQSAAAGKTGK